MWVTQNIIDSKGYNIQESLSMYTRDVGNTENVGNMWVTGVGNTLYF